MFVASDSSKALSAARDSLQSQAGPTKRKKAKKALKPLGTNAKHHQTIRIFLTLNWWVWKMLEDIPEGLYHHLCQTDVCSGGCDHQPAIVYNSSRTMVGIPWPDIAVTSTTVLWMLWCQWLRDLKPIGIYKVYELLYKSRWSDWKLGCCASNSQSSQLVDAKQPHFSAKLLSFFFFSNHFLGWTLYDMIFVKSASSFPKLPLQVIWNRGISVHTQDAQVTDQDILKATGGIKSWNKQMLEHY